VRYERWNRDRPPTEAELRARLVEEGYSVYAWTDAPGAVYPPHTHDDDQSHWIVRGALALVVDGVEYVLAEGDRDWLPAKTIHAARVVGDEPVTYLIASKPRSAR
jgi:quercetin dioxygenase-like cupin family protein